VLIDEAGNPIPNGSDMFDLSIRSSFDPNQMTVIPEILNNSEELNELIYKVSFENIGQGTANNIELYIDLDDKLDGSTLKVLADYKDWSHNSEALYFYSTPIDPSTPDLPDMPMQKDYKLHFKTVRWQELIPITRAAFKIKDGSIFQ
jgi:hypothetical protein